MAESRLTLFTRDLQKSIFETNNDFYKFSKKDGSSSTNTVDIPQSSAAMQAEIGNVQQGYDLVGNHLTAADKLTTYKHINTKKFYENQNFLISSRVVDRNNQDGELSYDKLGAIREEMASAFRFQIGNWAAVNFAPSLTDNIVKTTGTLVRQGSVIGGYAGDVKRITRQDIETVVQKFMLQNMFSKPGNIYCLPTPQQWSDLMNIPEFYDGANTGNRTILKDGEVGVWYNKIVFLMPRNNELLGANATYDLTTPATPVKDVYIEGGTPARYGITPTANSTSAAIFWHESAVRHSEGNVNVYFRRDDPEYQGDIISANVRFGATISRLDERGVIALLEDKVV